MFIIYNPRHLGRSFLLCFLMAIGFGIGTFHNAPHFDNASAICFICFLWSLGLMLYCVVMAAIKFLSKFLDPYVAAFIVNALVLFGILWSIWELGILLHITSSK